MPCKLCQGCACIKPKSSFTDTEFKRLDDNDIKVGICKFCQAIQREKKLPLQCTSCFSFRAETDYPPRETHWTWSSKRVCRHCKPKKKCSVCELFHERQHFSDKEWLRMTKQTLDGKCMQCVRPRPANGSKFCRMCREAKPDSEFGMWDIRHTSKDKHAKSCDTCLLQAEVKRKGISRGNQQHIQKSNDGISACQPVLNPKVTVFCSECDAAKEIDFELIWKKGKGAHSFIDLLCQSEYCTQQKRVSLGKWLRFLARRRK